MILQAALLICESLVWVQLETDVVLHSLGNRLGNSEAIYTPESIGDLSTDGTSRLSARIAPQCIGYLVSITVSKAVVTWLMSMERLCTNTLLASRGTDSKMEWAYAFDLQCNGFVALFSWLYVLQLFLLPVVTGHKWISILAGNTLYFVA